MASVKPRKALFTVYSDAPSTTTSSSKRTSAKSIGKQRSGGLGMSSGKAAMEDGKVVKPKRSLVLAKIQADAIDEEAPISSPLAPKDNSARASRPAFYRTRSSASSVKTVTAATPTAATVNPAETASRPALAQKPRPAALEDFFDGKTPFAPASPDVVAPPPQQPMTKPRTTRKVGPKTLQKSTAGRTSSRAVESKKSLFAATAYNPNEDALQPSIDLNSPSDAPALIPLNLDAPTTSNTTVSEPLPEDAVCPTAPRIPFAERFESAFGPAQDEDDEHNLYTPTFTAGFRRTTFEFGSQENERPSSSSAVGRGIKPFARGKGLGKGVNGQVSPLAEVTEAFTGQQGAWGPPLESPPLPRAELPVPSPSSASKRPRADTLVSSDVDPASAGNDSIPFLCPSAEDLPLPAPSTSTSTRDLPSKTPALEVDAVSQSLSTVSLRPSASSSSSSISLSAGVPKLAKGREAKRRRGGAGLGKSSLGGMRI